MNNNDSSMGMIVGILVVVVILIVGFIAYKQGFFKGTAETPTQNGIQVQVGGNSPSTTQ